MMNYDWGIMEGAWVAGIFGIIGSLTGGIITYLSSYQLHNKKIKEDGKIVSQSLAAEIQSIISLLHDHNYEQGLNIAIEKTSRGEPYAMVWPVKKDYCRVFNGNVSRIGILTVGAPETVKFYNLIQSLIEDLDTLGTDIVVLIKSGYRPGPQWVTFTNRYTVIQSKLRAVITAGQIALEKLESTNK